MQLVINAGSSSLKYSLFSSEISRAVVTSGMFEKFGAACVFSSGKQVLHQSIPNHGAAVEFLIATLARESRVDPQRITSVVHRVVHGGEEFAEPVIIDARVEEVIESLSFLAPLHNPANLAGIRACKRALPRARHVAVFDTAFHHTIHPEVFRYAIPEELYKKFGIRKYGFHGSSHAFIARTLKERYGKHVDAISCHLGAGSSVTALRHGKSADTTMGFTPLDGLVMATRSGELDPEIPLFLQKELGFSVEEVEELLSKRSGLLGLTGSPDLRVVYQRARHGDEQARLAIDILSYRVAYFVNAMKTAVPSPRAIVFTAGIGEKAWYVRRDVCKLLGIELDAAANKRNEQVISDRSSEVEVLVIPTDEQLEMHLQAHRALAQ